MNDPHRCKSMVGRRAEWMYCNACNGRVHESECTSRRNPKVDCCDRRHLDLYAAGHERGLTDASVMMLEGVKS
jgi:hypothetical protein